MIKQYKKLILSLGPFIGLLSKVAGAAASSSTDCATASSSDSIGISAPVKSKLGLLPLGVNILIR